MISDQKSCIRDAVLLLREVQAALSGGANTVLVARIEEVLRQLKELEKHDGIDPEKLADVLRILGEGLALIPMVVDLLQRLHR